MIFKREQGLVLKQQKMANRLSKTYFEHSDTLCEMMILSNKTDKLSYLSDIVLEGICSCNACMAH